MLPIRCFDQGGRLGCARSVAAPVNTLSCRRLQLSMIDTAESRLVLQGAGHGPITFEVEHRDLIHLASHFTAAILEQCEHPCRCELPLVRDQNDLISLQPMARTGIVNSSSPTPSTACAAQPARASRMDGVSAQLQGPSRTGLMPSSARSSSRSCPKRSSQRTGNRGWAPAPISSPWLIMRKA